MNLYRVTGVGHDGLRTHQFVEAESEQAAVDKANHIKTAQWVVRVDPTTGARLGAPQRVWERT